MSGGPVKRTHLEYVRFCLKKEILCWHQDNLDHAVTFHLLLYQFNDFPWPALPYVLRFCQGGYVVHVDQLKVVLASEEGMECKRSGRGQVNNLVL